MTLLVALACLPLFGDDPPTQEAPKTGQSAPADLVSALETVIQDAIARAEPSIVAINRRKSENPDETLAVRGRQRSRSGFRPQGLPSRFPFNTVVPDTISFDFGSGVVVGDEGQILTAYHVVRGAASLEVRAADRQVFSAEIIAADPRSDMAVIVPIVDAGSPPPRLKPIVLGDSTRLRKGSFLIALGNPFNAAQDGKPSASWGILSNVARRVEPNLDGTTAGPKYLSFTNYPTLLQLDAKLNLGMSGGAVINLKGELVGLTTTASSPAGFDAMAGYAIPMDRIGRRAVGILKQGKEIEYGLLGIYNPPQGPPTNKVEGIYPNSPADQAHLLVNDEISGVDDAVVRDWDTLILAINSHAPGEPIQLKIRRSGEEMVKTVVLAKYPVDPEMIATNRPAPWRGLRVDYLSTAATVRGGFPFENPEGGVVVSEVEEDSPAARAGLKKFQVIHKVEKTAVSKPADFAQAVADLKGPVTLSTNLGPVTLPE
ncbi:MAG: trypsin-like peptidase domain-containing protein [Isosphaeraceae bacterium]